MKYGFSLSKEQCEWLEISYIDILAKLKDSKFSVVRIGLYWNEIEKEKGIYDFKEAEEIINLASGLGYEIILTVGMKAPRWPEFYFPDFYFNADTPEEVVYEKCLNFVRACVIKFKNIPSISTWQIENEPLDESGPLGLTVQKQHLQNEIDLVRSLDSDRDILITAWGNDLKKRNTLKKMLELKNVNQLGFDFYPRRPISFFFTGPDVSLKEISQLSSDVRLNGMTPVISELQAEPWEERFDYRQYPERIKSISLKQIEKNINNYKELGYETILLWGIEYCEWAGILEKVADLI